MPRIPYINAKNASELGKIGGVARQAQAKQAQVELKAKLAQTEKDLAEAVNPTGYEARTLARVRVQLEQVYALFKDEKDPAKLDRLASAQARLAEQERQLAGRPLPGSLKPSSKPSRSRSSQFSQPVEPDEPDQTGTSPA